MHTPYGPNNADALCSRCSQAGALRPSSAVLGTCPSEAPHVGAETHTHLHYSVKQQKSHEKPATPTRRQTEDGAHKFYSWQAMRRDTSSRNEADLSPPHPGGRRGVKVAARGHTWFMRGG